MTTLDAPTQATHTETDPTNYACHPSIINKPHLLSNKNIIFFPGSPWMVQYLNLSVNEEFVFMQVQPLGGFRIDTWMTLLYTILCFFLLSSYQCCFNILEAVYCIIISHIIFYAVIVFIIILSYNKGTRTREFTYKFVVSLIYCTISRFNK